LAQLEVAFTHDRRATAFTAVPLQSAIAQTSERRLVIGTGCVTLVTTPE